MARVGLYARVSTKSQDTNNQLLELHEVSRRNDWNVVQEFVDEGISGAKGRDQRPEFDRLMKSVVKRGVDLIACWSVDRLGRSLRDLVGFISLLDEKGVDLYVHQQGLDTTTSAGRMMFQMCGVFAEFERSLIRERVIAGQLKAKAQGKHIGRRSIIDGDLRANVLRLKSSGVGIKRIASDLGMPASMLMICNELTERKARSSLSVIHCH